MRSSRPSSPDRRSSTGARAPVSRGRPAIALAAVLTALILAGCSSNATVAPSAAEPSTAGSGAVDSRAATPTISDAWVRPSTGTSEPVAAYMVITNGMGTDDALIAASSPAASSVELHETTTDTSGMTGMKPLARLDVPAGSTVRLAPGGVHLMAMGVTQPLKVGDTLELDLTFEHAGRVPVQAEVRPG